MSNGVMERRLWKYVRSNLSAHVNLRRIENAVLSGDPDVYWWNAAAKSGWIELKAGRRPARALTKVFGRGGLRPAQVEYIAELARCGINVHILAKVGDTLFLIKGKHAWQFNKMTYDDLVVYGDWMNVGNMSEIGWEQLALTLELPF